MLRHVAVALLLLVCVAPARAKRGPSRAVQCRQACVATIKACVDGGGRATKCARSIRRQCRKVGLSACPPPSSGTFLVAPSGADAASCGTPTAPCATMQFVVDTLVPRGTSATVKVAAGTYDQPTSCDAGTGADHAVLCVVDKQVTLVGGFAPPDWDTPSHDPTTTVIDAHGSGRGVVAVRSSAAQPTAGVDMDGFTITNGVAQGATQGDAMHTWAFGGGMLGGDCPVALRHVVFRNNTATGGTTSQPDGARGSGGGLALTGNQGGSIPTATLTDVTFLDNQARGGDGAEAGGYALGGALFANGYAVSGDGVVFTNNAATAGSSSGDGVSGTDKADALGGAVAAELDSTVDLRHLQASGNVATGGNAPNGDGGGAFGGAFFAELATLSLTDAVVGGNRARSGDGRNAVAGSSIAQGGGVMATTSSLTLDRVVMVDNEARAGDGAVNGGIPEGGGLAVTIGSRGGHDLPFTITNAVIASNAVSVGAGALAGGGGGAMWIQGATGTIAHATFADDVLGEPHLLGGALGVLPLAGYSTHASLVNCIVANHQSPSTGPGVYTNAALWVAQNATLDVTGVLFAHNVHDSNAGIWDVLNVPSGTVNLSGVITAPDAGFVSPGDPSNDYHLTPTSPAVDQAAASSVTVDLDGHPRPVGSAPDLGAYELGS